VLVLHYVAAEWQQISQTADGTLVCIPTAGGHAQPAVKHCPKKALRGKRRCDRLGGASAERWGRALPGDQLCRPAARTRRSAADAPSAHRRGRPAKGRPAASQHHQKQIHLNVPQPHQQHSRISNQFAAGRWRKSPPGDQRAKSSTDRINVPTSHSPAALPNSAGRVYQAQSQYHE